jgi:hypothetical protein
MAIVYVSGCASTNAPLMTRSGNPAAVRQHEEKVRNQGRKDTTNPAARQPAQSKGATCYYQYDTCAAMATIRYHEKIRRDLDKAWQRTEQVQKLLNSIQQRR